MSTYLKDKHALVLGASGGIGHAVARKYVSAGVSALTLTYHSNQPEAESLAEELKEKGVKVYVTNVDRMDPVSINKMLENAVAANGQEIDILADNIGYSPDLDFQEQTPELWLKVLSTNLVGCFVSSRAVVNRMVEKGVQGRVVIVTSINGRRTFGPYSAPYNASKAGQESLVKDLMLEYAPKGLHINGVAPGWIDTKMNETVPKEDWAVELPKITMGRLGRPEEVANLVVSLSGDMSDYTNGTIYDIDGGYGYR